MRQWIVVIVVGTGISSGGMATGAPFRTGVSASDEQLVEKAMDADLAGDTTGRRDILNQALKQRPQDAAIRWKAGYVRGTDRNWYTIDEFSQRQEANPDLEVYRQRRHALVDTLTGHMELARWCMRNDLPLQERFHWLAVLQFDPRNKTARIRLKIGDYDGQLMGHQQVTDLKLQRREYDRNLKKWRPRVKHWLKDLQDSDTYRRLTAMEAIWNVRDPAAIPALVQTLHVTGDWRTEWRYLKELGRKQAEPVAHRAADALVGAMGNMPQHDATLILVDQAVLSPWEDVRRAATEQLKSRRMTDYVPLLIANMHLVDRSTYGERSRLPDGSSGGQLFVETFDATFSLDYHRMRSSQTAREAGVDASEVAQNAAEVSRLESVSRAWFARAQSLNPRIHYVLAQVGGEDYASDPRTCWDAWRDYNELSKPTYKPEYSYAATAARYAPETCECFVAGTPVWTVTGLQAIETIVAGDQVLAQDPTTGELAYKCVVDTTYREPNPTVRIQLNDESIVTTRGHRFWQTGYGWRMAKFLDSGMRLSTTAGSLPIESVETASSEAAFNLVVADFHTYFVGRSRVLVHDNGCPQPTLAVIPGWQQNSQNLQP